MGTILCVWKQEEVRSVIKILWVRRTIRIEVHREIQAVYVPNVMTVQHVRKCCREFSGCRASVTDEHTSGRRSTTVDLVPAIEESVRDNRRESLNL